MPEICLCNYVDNEQTHGERERERNLFNVNFTEVHKERERERDEYFKFFRQLLPLKMRKSYEAAYCRVHHMTPKVCHELKYISLQILKLLLYNTICIVGINRLISRLSNTIKKN